MTKETKEKPKHMARVKAKGLVKIIDKDGNEKARLKVVSLEQRKEKNGN